jgi:hypothetical protein
LKRAAEMADDKSTTAPEDVFLISLTEDYDVAYWAKRFAVSKVRLAEAVRRVGPSAAAVEAELKQEDERS